VKVRTDPASSIVAVDISDIVQLLAMCGLIVWTSREVEARLKLSRSHSESV